jgi:NAD-dependent dihydropyrimidine dehydrogenase PreA subunit
MCDFCLKHGEGGKWYLRAENYSEDLLRDARRHRFIERFFTETDELQRSSEQLRRLDRAPSFVRSLARRLVARRMKKVHYGQVVPIEDLERILHFANSVVRVACICRQVTLGQERRYCYGISLGPNGGRMGEILRGLDRSFLNGPDAAGVETLGKEAALAAWHDHEQEGLCHTIWTFHAPFIGGVCNCDRSDCLAMRSTVSHGLPLMFRAEYVAVVDQDLCAGCRQCLRLCQFGALSFSASHQKAVCDQRWCYGCGICRAACPKGAIRLVDRRTVPAAAGLW